MANLFDGPPDARQSDDPHLPVSRFRPRYRALSQEEQNLHDAIKATAGMLEALYDNILPGRRSEAPAGAGRYHALAMTALEESVMWAVKSLTTNA
jgi:hypothetical protein